MQFAKLLLAALVFALSVVACSGGGSSSSGGGGDNAGIVPTTFDLSVTTFSVSSSSIVAGDAITFAATVTNDSSANVSSSVAALKYYRSTDTTIDSTADTEVGTADSIGALAAAATESKTAIVNPSTAGTFYYGACVVATDDRDTSNDCSAGMRVVVAARDFDLSVTAFSVSPSSIVAGEAITFSATVTNDSSATVPSSVAELKYYRSTDATIDSTTDTEVGTADSIGALAAAATESKTAIVNPRTAGTFYYGACVVATDDRDTSNDCSTGVQVVVAAQDFDLSVTAFSVSPSSIVAGEAITFSATVTNDASATVSSSVAALKYYRSTDATIDSTADTEVGTAASISALAAAATESKIAIVNPSTAGTFYYGACVVSTGDSDTSNDCSTGVQVDVAAQDFDLSVTAFSFDTGVESSNSRDSIGAASTPITLTATIGNASSAMHSSSTATLKYYLSSDGTITTSDTEVGTADSISALAPAATKVETATDSLPTVLGANGYKSYYYGACIVATGDSDTSNDCSAGVRVVVTPHYDLSVTASVSDASVDAGEALILTVTVGNASSAIHSSPNFDLRYYRSSDATITIHVDPILDVSHFRESVAPGATKTITAGGVSWTKDVGTYYYGACVGELSHDHWLFFLYDAEIDKSNNCSAGVQVDVADLGFDLSVTAFSAAPLTVVAGDAITFSTTVTNDASATASSHPRAVLRYYRSPDATITSGDTVVGADSISALAATATESETAFVNLRTVGTFYYGACAVATGDSDTSNDCSAGVQVVVVERYFDLSVTAFSASDTSVVVGDDITFTATVRNDASAMHSSPATALGLDYYRSSDSTITTSDRRLTSESVGELAAGATETILDILRTRDRHAGTYYYGACADVTGDSDASNDCSAGVQVEVTASSP